MIPAPFKKAEALSFDTETTGLRPFKGDKPFAAVLSDGGETVYVDLGDEDAQEELRRLLAERPRTYFMHNAKFDMHHAARLGLEFHAEATFQDTAVLARLVDSDLRGGYSLANCGNHFLGQQKLDTAMAYVEEHVLWEWADIPGVARREKVMHFDQIPREIIEPYAKQDALLTFRLAVYLLDMLRDRAAKFPSKPIANLVKNESRLVATCYRMEKSGVKLDIPFVKEALAHEQENFQKAIDGFRQETGHEYVASAKAFTQAFNAVGVETESLSKTDKGNTQFDHKALSGIAHASARLALDAKDAKARINFFSQFLHFADPQGVLHTNYRQAGTKPGRFSSSEPNIQNLSRPDIEETEAGASLERYPVRRALVPFSVDYSLVMLDFSQQEYRLMLDYAGEMGLIEKILGGLDVHAATAELTGLKRFEAKTLNFALLYGAGAGKVGEMLGLTLSEASGLIEQYFGRLPMVKKFIWDVKNAAKVRGFIFNWFGRMVHYPDRTECYAAPNHLIQGGGADVIRVAMNQTDELLLKTRSHLTLSIHDELVLNIHKNEFDLIPKVKLIMETVYPYRHLPLTVDVSHSWASLADKVKGLPTARA